MVLGTLIFSQRVILREEGHKPWEGEQKELRKERALCTLGLPIQTLKFL